MSESHCAKCDGQVTSATPVVCAECYQKAVDGLGEVIRKLQGEVLNEKTSHAIFSVFAEASGRWSTGRFTPK